MFYHPNPDTGVLGLEESYHCTKVLRIKAGADITLFDGKGNSYDCEILAIGKQCTYKINKTTTHHRTSIFSILAIAPPKKASRLDFMIEKLVELGLSKLYFLETQHSERSRLNPERIEKQVISACKQSRQYFIPEIFYKKSIKDMIGLNHSLMVCHCNPNFPKHGLKDMVNAEENRVWLIGPEGDFSSEELKTLEEANAKFIDLGEQRLRTETAAIYIMSSLKYTKD